MKVGAFVIGVQNIGSKGRNDRFIALYRRHHYEDRMSHNRAMERTTMAGPASGRANVILLTSYAIHPTF